MFCFINRNCEIVGIYWNHLQIAQLVSAYLKKKLWAWSKICLFYCMFYSLPIVLKEYRKFSSAKH